MLLIKQIITANNWYALYEIDSQTIAIPLVCWANIDDHGDSRIAGMIHQQGKIVFVWDVEGFKCYDSDSKGIDSDWAVYEQRDRE